MGSHQPLTAALNLNSEMGSPETKSGNVQKGSIDLPIFRTARTSLRQPKPSKYKEYTKYPAAKSSGNRKAGERSGHQNTDLQASSEAMDASKRKRRIKVEDEASQAPTVIDLRESEELSLMYDASATGSISLPCTPANSTLTPAAASSSAREMPKRRRTQEARFSNGSRLDRSLSSSNDFDSTPKSRRSEIRPGSEAKGRADAFDLLTDSSESSATDDDGISHYDYEFGVSEEAKAEILADLAELMRANSSEEVIDAFLSFNIRKRKLVIPGIVPCLLNMRNVPKKEPVKRNWLVSGLLSSTYKGGQKRERSEASKEPSNLDANGFPEESSILPPPDYALEWIWTEYLYDYELPYDCWCAAAINTQKTYENWKQEQQSLMEESKDESPIRKGRGRPKKTGLQPVFESEPAEETEEEPPSFPDEPEADLDEDEDYEPQAEEEADATLKCNKCQRSIRSNDSTSSDDGMSCKCKKSSRRAAQASKAIPDNATANVSPPRTVGTRRKTARTNAIENEARAPATPQNEPIAGSSKGRRVVTKQEKAEVTTEKFVPEPVAKTRSVRTLQMQIERRKALGKNASIPPMMALEPSSSRPQRNQLVPISSLKQQKLHGASTSAGFGTEQRNSDPITPSPEEDNTLARTKLKTRLKPISGHNFVTSEARAFAEFLQKEIIVNDMSTKWSDVAGLKTAKMILQESLFLAKELQQFFGSALPPWRGLMLYGPPGTGKTLLAKAVATECKTTFFNISSPSLISEWNSDAGKIKILFDLARHHAPSTIFFDEFDALSSRRGHGETDAARRFKSEILQQMDFLNSCNDEKPVFVLTATNLPWDVDAAMLRRLEKRVYIPLPNLEERKEIFRLNFAKIAGTAAREGKSRSIEYQVDLSQIAGLTDGYSGSDIYQIAKGALITKFRESISSASAKLVILTEDVTRIIETVSPTCDKALVQSYLEWEKRR